jgi:hypothetical protein
MGNAECRRQLERTWTAARLALEKLRARHADNT